jgi:hypothetical protein
MTWIHCFFYAVLATILTILSATVLVVFSLAIRDEYRRCRLRQLQHHRRRHPPPWRRLRT